MPTHSLKKMLDFKDFRFRCLHLDETIKFYTHCLNMNLEKKVNTSTRVYFYLRYQKGDCGIRFEYDLLLSSKLKQSKTPQVATKPISECDMLFYVQGIDKIVEKVEVCKFSVFVPPENINHDTRSCVLVDPNGIRVRLVDCAHCLIESNSGARLGNITVPVQEFHALNKTISFYQSVFGKLSAELRSLHYRVKEKEPESHKQDVPSVAATIQGRSTRDSQPTRVPNCFGLQDSETFVEDLTTFVWLGQRARIMKATLCLRHIMTRENKADNLSSVFGGGHNSKERFFLGTTFTVQDLERSFNFLETQDMFPLQLSPISSTQGLPRSYTFFDPAFVNVEVADESLSRNLHRHR